MRKLVDRHGVKNIRETRVLFRKVVDNPLASDVVAVFPDEISGPDGNMLSYMYVGQHSECSRDFVINDTVATKSGCDVHGCMEKHLEEVIGYDDLVIVDDLEVVGYKPKCLYCESGNEPTHFVCESCGDGMCDECYDIMTEHDAHYQDPAPMAETEEGYLALDDAFSNGYGCEECVQKVLRMVKNAEEDK
jgi:hypothetical protein